MKEIGTSLLLTNFSNFAGVKITEICLNNTIQSLELCIKDWKESRGQKKKDLGMTDVDIDEEITDFEKARENCMKILKSHYNEREINRQLELEKLYVPTLLRNKLSSQPSLNFSLITKIAIIIVIVWLILKN